MRWNYKRYFYLETVTGDLTKKKNLYFGECFDPVPRVFA